MYREPANQVQITGSKVISFLPLPFLFLYDSSHCSTFHLRLCSRCYAPVLRRGFNDVSSCHFQQAAAGGLIRCQQLCCRQLCGDNRLPPSMPSGISKKNPAPGEFIPKTRRGGRVVLFPPLRCRYTENFFIMQQKFSVPLKTFVILI